MGFLGYHSTRKRQGCPSCRGSRRRPGGLKCQTEEGDVRDDQEEANRRLGPDAPKQSLQ